MLIWPTATRLRPFLCLPLSSWCSTEHKVVKQFTGAFREHRRRILFNHVSAGVLALRCRFLSVSLHVAHQFAQRFMVWISPQVPRERAVCGHWHEARQDWQRVTVVWLQVLRRPAPIGCYHRQTHGHGFYMWAAPAFASRWQHEAMGSFEELWQLLLRYLRVEYHSWQLI